jgi:hypothetical protein
MNVLLIGAVGMLFTALVLAWVATFAKLIVVRPVQALIKDYGSLIRAHIDLLLMCLLCLALYAIRIPIPAAACWMVVVGGFTNPSLFLLRAVRPDAPMTWRRQAFRLFSFVTTTAGFGWTGYALLRALP